MYAQVDKSKENKSRAVANSVAQKKSNVKQGFGFVDNRPEAVVRNKPSNIQTILQNKSFDSLQRVKNRNDNCNNQHSDIQSITDNRLVVSNNAALVNTIAHGSSIQFVHPAFNSFNYFRPTIGLEPGNHHPLSPEGQLKRLTAQFGADLAKEILYTEADEEDALKREEIVAEYLSTKGDDVPNRKFACEALKGNPKNNETLKRALYDPKYTTPFENYWEVDRYREDQEFGDQFEGKFEPLPALARYKYLQNLSHSNERSIVLAEDIETKSKVIIKVIRKEFMLDEDDVDEVRAKNRFLAEVEIQKRMSVPGFHSLKLHKVIEGKYNAYIVMDFANEGTLEDKVAKSQKLAPKDLAKLMQNMVKSLSELYKQGFAHRDIKPENIFYKDGEPLLGDYGLSESTDQKQEEINQEVGNPLYASPEVLKARLGEKSDEFDLKKADTFMLGMVLFQQFAGKMPYPKESLAAKAGAMGAEDVEYGKQIATIEKGDFLKELPSEVQKLLVKMLNIEPSERISIEELSDDPDYHNLLRFLGERGAHILQNRGFVTVG